LRRRVAEGTPVIGLWVTLDAPSVTEIAVGLGLDWVVIDAEHGHLDWQEVVAHIRAAVRSSTVVLVRITELNAGAIKRALDIGADGIVVPWVESAEQLRQAVSFARYPLDGVRGIGAERATAWGQAFVEHTSSANQHVLVVPIIETVRAARQVPAMLTVDGVELFFFGPADFSASAGHRGQWEGPGVAEQILELKDKIVAAGKQCGVMVTSHDDLAQRVRQGFRMLGLGTDAGLLIRSVRESLRVVNRDAQMRADLSTGEPLASAPSPTSAPLTTPPESFRPDRLESMNKVGAQPRIELAPGVMFDPLVGKHNGARNLTTGLVTFAPGARLPTHDHEFTESVTVLDGVLTFEVEGRQYRLERLDNVTIPRGVAHSAVNAGRQPVVVSVALASDTPARRLIDQFFPRRQMPDAATGVPGKERVTRTKSAARSAAGPNTEFVDFFNAELMPGIEMSGGYALFHPGGRLPAHLHDFDESISIISGQATCVVEGRRYAMSDRATALQPRGRVHYFINESRDTMEMIWVYAGPRPERIIVAESCATVEGNPWK
jgi:2-keto-3-deoxy-L-rhamnonate aldolase RhmA/quercetin dioxygenase-like cupin family protein